MRAVIMFFLLLCFAFASASPARAIMLSDNPQPVSVVAIIDLSEQTFVVFEGTVVYGPWLASTDRDGLDTEIGVFRPDFLSRHHRSSRINNAPMPFSVFYHGNVAIHATTEVDLLGQPASAGCVRLSLEHAKTFFELVRDYGLEDVIIRVVE